MRNDVRESVCLYVDVGGIVSGVASWKERAMPVRWYVLAMSAWQVAQTFESTETSTLGDVREQPSAKIDPMTSAALIPRY
jgi:hypothetical protein